MKKEYEEAIQNFCLFDDTYLNAFFNGQLELIQFVLRIIMSKETLVVTEMEIQKPLKNLHGRSIELDVHAVDAEGKIYNIEIQQQKVGAAPQRARYHSALMDANLLKAGEYFDKLPETYIIFLAKENVLGEMYGVNLPVYKIERHVDIGDDNLKPFNDGMHILYVNGEYVDNTPIGWLIHDFLCKNSQDMHYEELANRTSALKDYKGGQGTMCEIMDALVKKEIKRDRVEAIQNLIKAGTSLEVIASSFSISIEEVENIAKNISPN